MKKFLSWQFCMVILGAFLIAGGIFFRFGLPFFFEHGKNGIGALERGYYVDLSSPVNALGRFGEKSAAWVGRERNVTETTLLTPAGVQQFSWHGLLSKDSYLVRYTPTHVYLLSVHRFFCGYYTRDPVELIQLPAASAEASH